MVSGYLGGPATHTCLQLTSRTRVVVVGASGMVGRAVTRYLATSGSIEVLGFARNFENHLDLGDDPRGLVRGADLVVNCVGLLRSNVHYPGAEYRAVAAKVNAWWPHRLADAIAHEGACLIHLSTDAVFAPLAEPADEGTPLAPSEPYGWSKALGETQTAASLNIRCSVVGPASGRAGGLWEWLISRPYGAEILGFDDPWSGCTSLQVAHLIMGLADSATFAHTRSRGGIAHFSPNGIVAKNVFLMALADRLRPDLTIQLAHRAPTGRPLITATGALDAAYAGPRGWSAAVDTAVDFDQARADP